jgi:pyruvate/2-oxoglutarate dehydrogenase complex dihydrolipoamide dehydrogenase (E3) component
VTTDRIVLASGGRPVIPGAVEKSGLPFETSDTVMRIDEPPRRLAVLGGGYIAAELAHVFATAGGEITIIEESDTLLGGPPDQEIRMHYTDLMSTRYDLMLLVAAGRRSNGDTLNLAAAGVDSHDDGRIVVDEFCRTSADGIFALGDVSTPIPLKHVANREAEVVKHNLLHPDHMRAVDHELVPSAVFADPQMASVGLTEQSAVNLTPTISWVERPTATSHMAGRSKTTPAYARCSSTAPSGTFWERTSWDRRRRASSRSSSWQCSSASAPTTSPTSRTGFTRHSPNWSRTRCATSGRRRRSAARAGGIGRTRGRRRLPRHGRGGTVETRNRCLRARGARQR